MERTINCAVECTQGCILGEKCPNQEYVRRATQFMQETSLEQMLEIAEAARLQKLTAPTKWIIPEDF